MTDHREFDPDLSAEQRDELALAAQRLEDARPIPGANFRGDLRRRLLSSGGRESFAEDHFRLWVAGYSLAGLICLAVAAVGLVGTGPFAV